MCHSLWQGNTIPSVLFADEETPLSERLKKGHGEVFDPVPSVLLRKYIGYARKYVHPQLTPDAADVLKVCKCTHIPPLGGTFVTDTPGFKSLLMC